MNLSSPELLRQADGVATRCGLVLLPEMPQQGARLSGRLLDPDFKYVPSNATDIRKTFARVKRELKAAAKQKQVVPIRRTSK